jgi:hypothetical protein
VFDEVERAGDFRGDGDEADVAAGGLLEPFEEGDGGRLDVCGWVNAAFGVGDEWAFEMDPNGICLCSWMGTICGFDGVGEELEGAEGGVDGGGDGGGEVICNSFGC